MTRKKIYRYYKDKINPAAPDYQILGWESASAQELRFSVLAKHLSPNDSLLDVGCGVGSLFSYLKAHLDFPVRYTGIDLLPQMIQLAKARNPQGHFIHGDLFKNNPFPPRSFDICFASGIFNLQLHNNEAFIVQALRLFRQLAVKKIIFNLLNDQSAAKEAPYFYSNPSQLDGWLTAAARPNTPLPAYHIEKGYLDNDYTVILTINEPMSN